MEGAVESHSTSNFVTDGGTLGKERLVLFGMAIADEKI